MLGDFESRVAHELIQRDLDDWCQQIMDGIIHLHELSLPSHLQVNNRKDREEIELHMLSLLCKLYCVSGGDLACEQIQPRLDRPYTIGQLDPLWSCLWSPNAYRAAVRYMQSLWTAKSLLKIADFGQGHRSQPNLLDNSQRCSGLEPKSQ